MKKIILCEFGIDEKYSSDGYYIYNDGGEQRYPAMRFLLFITSHELAPASFTAASL